MNETKPDYAGTTWGWLFEERDNLRAQRDALLAALKDAAGELGHAVEFAGPMGAYSRAELARYLEDIRHKARAAIAAVTEAAR